jgi:hypothetical protein
MPSLIKRKGSDNWYYRRKIPKKILPLLDKLPKSRRPKHWLKTHIVISLGTADREKAKAKCPEVAAEVEKRIAALLEGPKPLSHKQVAALSGELYKGITQALEDNPVASSAQWLRVCRQFWNGRTPSQIAFQVMPALIHYADLATRKALIFQGKSVQPLQFNPVWQHHSPSSEFRK